MMEELDLLKKNWNKTNNFEQITESDIYKMLLKKSSSIVKWIFIVSLLELGSGLLLGLFLSFTKYDSEGNELLKNMGMYTYYIAVSIIFYSVILFFIYRFYQMYKMISVNDNVKKLIKSILKTRKVVKQYIMFNLSFSALFFLVGLCFGLHKGFMDYSAKHGDLNPVITMKMYLLGIVLIVVITGIFTFLFWLVYKLLYGILLKKLTKNYEELKKIDL